MQKPEPGLYPIYVRVDDANPTFQAGAVITLGAVRDARGLGYLKACFPCCDFSL
jgi:hypothetical protein